VEGRPTPAKLEVKVYTEEESAKLLAAAAGHRLAPLLVVAMDSGARQGELFALTWSDVDFQHGAITIRRSLEDAKGELRPKETKTKKGRRVDLSHYTMQVLADHRRAMLAEGHCRPDAPVFCDDTAPEIELHPQGISRVAGRGQRAPPPLPRSPPRRRDGTPRAWPSRRRSSAND
jgi:integrase